MLSRYFTLLKDTTNSKAKMCNKDSDFQRKERKENNQKRTFTKISKMPKLFK